MTRGKRADKHTIYYEVRDACAAGGCPVCTVTLRAVEHYLDSILYESVNVPPIRDAVIAARGYCNTHSWQVRALRGGLGAALMYRDVVRHVAERIATAPDGNGLSIFAGGGDGGSGMLGRLAALTGTESGARRAGQADPHVDCPACQERTRFEELYLGAVFDHVGDEEFAAAFRSAGGLCLVHLDQALGLRVKRAVLERLLALQRAAMLALHDDLSEYIRKNDYRFTHEAMGVEGDSWVRAIAFAAGKEGIR